MNERYSLGARNIYFSLNVILIPKVLLVQAKDYMTGAWVLKI